MAIEWKISERRKTFLDWKWEKNDDGEKNSIQMEWNDIISSSYFLRIRVAPIFLFTSTDLFGLASVVCTWRAWTSTIRNIKYIIKYVWLWALLPPDEFLAVVSIFSCLYGLCAAALLDCAKPITGGVLDSTRNWISGWRLVTNSTNWIHCHISQDLFHGS